MLMREDEGCMKSGTVNNKGKNPAIFESTLQHTEMKQTKKVTTQQELWLKVEPKDQKVHSTLGGVL